MAAGFAIVLRATLKRAVDLIVASQNSKGGWRYYPESTDADISVTICQIMALRGAQRRHFRPQGHR